jgi:uncharacterized membrane protein
MYLVLKLLHVMSAVVFLGNIITGLFWHAHAARTRDARLLFHAMDGIIRSDRWFTLPGVVLITLTGVATAMHAHLPIWGTPWIRWALVLFAISGVLYGAVLAPLQLRLRELARAGQASGSFDLEHYERLARVWDGVGIAALLTPIGALVLMVLKPV